MYRKLVLGTAAAALAVTPVVAEATAPRTASPVTDEQEALRGTWLWPVVIAIAIGLGIYLIANDDDPASP